MIQNGGRGVDGGAQETIAAGHAGSRGVAARSLTEVFAPAHLVIGLPLLVGATTHGWAGIGWGLLAAVLCGGIPGVVIAVGVRTGWFEGRHLRDRAERPKLLAVIVSLVVVALVSLAWLGAPRVMVATVAVMLATLAVTAPVTLWWKISFHTAVAAGTVVTLGYVLPPVAVYGLGAVLVGLVGWARVELGDHTVAQTVAGAAAGVAATGSTLAALLP